MKLKTSVTLEEETVMALDREAGSGTNRSRLIEQAILEFLDRRRRAARTPATSSSSIEARASSTTRCRMSSTIR